MLRIFLISVCAVWCCVAETEEKEPCIETPEVGKYFSSQNFPDNFNKDYDGRQGVNCTFQLKVEEGKKLLLTFYSIDLSSYCDDSYLRILNFNETDENERDNSYLCGKSFNNKKVLSETNELEFQFYHQRWSSYKGWLAKYEAVDSQMDINQQDKYLVHYPGNFVKNRTEQICVESLDGQQYDVTVHLIGKNFDEPIGFRRPPGPRPVPFSSRAALSEESGAEYFEPEENDIPESTETIEGTSEECLEIKTTMKATRAMLRILISGDNGFNEELYRFVNVHTPKDEVLIQTDKGKYKAGSNVTFRWITLDDELKSSGLKVSEIKVTDPKQRIIKQWKLPQNEDGINQQSFALFEEAPLGRYTITVKVDDAREVEATFEVAEYTLPRFEISLKDPSAVIPGSDSTWKVCADYTHGAPVPGSIKASFSIRRNRWEDGQRDYFNKTVDKTSEESSCTDVVLSSEELKNLTKSYSKSTINLDIEFTEDGTEEIQTASSRNTLAKQEFKIEFGSSTNNFVVGGFPYTGQVKVSNYDGKPRPGEQLKICTRLFRDLQKVRNQFNNMWNFNEDDFISRKEHIENLTYAENCKEHTTDNSGNINFFVKLNGISKEVKKLSIKVNPVNYQPKESSLSTPSGKLDVDLTHTVQDFAMSIQSKDRSELSCGQDNTVLINFAAPKDTEHNMKYYIMAGGHVLKSDTIPVEISGESENLNEDSVEFSYGGPAVEPVNTVTKSVKLVVPVDYRSYPDMKLVIVANYENSTLTDSHEFKVGYCTKHQVNLKLNKSQTQPRGAVKMTLNADQDSKCGVSLVDKSVDILGNDNKVTQEKVGDLLRNIKSSKTRVYSDNYKVTENCPEIGKFIQEFIDAGRQVHSNMRIFQDCETVTRKKGYSYGGGSYDDYDTGESFISYSAVPSMDNVQDMQRPMAPVAVSMRRKESDFSAEQQNSASSTFDPKAAPTVRTEFPETWLFDLVPIQQFKSEVYAPDTLTSWTAEAVCLSPSNGLGVATPQKLVVTQDFFADLRLPASVKRGESFPLNISVFNNLETQLPLTLTVEGDNIEASENNKQLCLDGQKSQLVSIPTKALKTGDVNITVSLEISSVQGCAEAVDNSGFVDRLERPVLVKPEGIPVEKVQSEMVCLKEGEQRDVQFERLVLPDETVSDSERAYVFTSGDVMAASLKNIGNLVQLPTGCGEQNMIRLAPNIYLLEYLQSNSKKMPELEEKAKGFMSIGYDRQAKYRHPGGAYSIWGGDDKKDGSTWLTAFVVKVFSQASKYIKVEKGPLEDSVQWLMSLQQEDGCFEKQGYVHSSSLQGGNSNSSLTSFVLISLSEYRKNMLQNDESPLIAMVDKAITNGLDCVFNELNVTASDDLYSMSLANYAANIAEDDTFEAQHDELRSALDAKANKTIPGAMFWDATSKEDDNNRRWWYYYPRSYTVEVTAYNIMSLVLEGRTDEAVDAVKWLARHRNSQGGFSSTQDTVVGLQALSVYGTIIGGYSTDMQLGVKKDGAEFEKLSLTEDNKQVLETSKLSGTPPYDVSFNLEGSGCVILQTSLRYNIPESKSEPAFKISHMFKKDILEVCTSYIGNKAETEMAIMEVEMLSGYSAKNPEDLLNEIEPLVKRVEVNEKENIVVLYFDKLDKEERCVELLVQQEFKVDDLKEARIHVYDYYNTEDDHQILYKP